MNVVSPKKTSLM